MLTTQTFALVPAQAPPQLPKTAPAVGLAVNVTWLPWA
jgi:hypothetical protein